MSRFAALVALFAVLASAGCPPPPDVTLAEEVPPAAAAVAAPSVSPDPKHAEPRPQPDATAAPASSVPVAPSVTAGAKPTTYEHLAGGVFVAHCTSCGAVQPPSSTKCPSCKQELTPWRQEQVCNVCAGSGRCDRCGDDRVCLDCDGLGACAICDGAGKLGAERCTECSGTGRCVACRGDGRRESVNRDFGPHETRLPGVCPTCVDGSGLCPECGAVTKGRGGAVCETCTGLGVCFDCGGTGLCAHDAGDGLCLVCRGGGREIVDGEPAKLSDRVWTLRTESGTPFTGRVSSRPDPNVHVQERQGATVTTTSYPRGKLSPLTYYLAMRDWTPETDGKALMDLGAVALSSGFWTVARQDFERAMSAEPRLAAEAAAQLRDIGVQRTDAWLIAAENSKKEGDRLGATLYVNMVRHVAPDTPQASRAMLVLLQLQQAAAEESDGRDDAARTKAAVEAKAQTERAAAGARLQLDRARKLLGQAQQASADDPRVERLLARADEAAYEAQRTVQRGAYRDPAPETPWPVKPEALVREGRLVRAEIAAFHAARAIAGGRYDFGRRLARRAAWLDPTNSKASQLVDEAELGLARRGVLHGSPAPRDK